jgi:hypothetical protein
LLRGRNNNFIGGGRRGDSYEEYGRFREEERLLRGRNDNFIGERRRGDSFEEYGGRFGYDRSLNNRGLELQDVKSKYQSIPKYVDNVNLLFYVIIICYYLQ